MPHLHIFVPPGRYDPPPDWLGRDGTNVIGMRECGVGGESLVARETERCAVCGGGVEVTVIGGGGCGEVEGVNCGFVGEKRLVGLNFCDGG